MRTMYEDVIVKCNYSIERWAEGRSRHDRAAFTRSPIGGEGQGPDYCPLTHLGGDCMLQHTILYSECKRRGGHDSAMYMLADNYSYSYSRIEDGGSDRRLQLKNN